MNKSLRRNGLTVTPDNVFLKIFYFHNRKAIRENNEKIKPLQKRMIIVKMGNYCKNIDFRRFSVELKKKITLLFELYIKTQRH